jgi:hypothetical protein
MRENLAEIIRFHATDETERAEVSIFVRSVVLQTLPIAQAWNDHLLAGSLNITGVQILLEQAFDQLTLIWMGLTPDMQRAFEDSLVEFWKEFKELRAQTKAKADAIIAKHKTNWARTCLNHVFILAVRPICSGTGCES